MPVIYYSYYTPVSDSISDISRQEHQLGRALLVRGLNEQFHLPLTISDIDTLLKYDSNGKPYLPDYPDIHFNITHCKELVACAFHVRSVGIDAEAPGYFPEVLINRALSEKEKCLLQSKSSTTSERAEWFYRLWTLKEAYVKQSGIGVDTDLTRFSFSFIDNKAALSVICSDSSVSCCQMKLSHGQILSICYEDTEETVELISCFQPRGQQR